MKLYTSFDLHSSNSYLEIIYEIGKKVFKKKLLNDPQTILDALCRKVSSKWISNEKAKGKGNKKNGNKYPTRAFPEAAELARQYYPEARAYYNRKMRAPDFMMEQAAFSHKMARAAYYVMRDQMPFMPEKLFES